jgi:hypothetical protein
MQVNRKIECNWKGIREKEGKIKQEKRIKRRNEGGKEIKNNIKREKKTMYIETDPLFVDILNLSGVRRAPTRRIFVELASAVFHEPVFST